MPPRIDPARREITVGSRRLPFRLDLRNDRVSVTLGGAETAVRPLQWREKVTLARFAELGPQFLRDEVIRLCTLTELPETLEEDDAAVLWELAAWMSESPAATPVPLDSRSLASVTLRLCRAMGLRPADFDTRSAPEVEAMWNALGEDGAAAPLSSSSDEAASSPMTTRIVIVPDPAPPDAGRASALATMPDELPVPDAGRASARSIAHAPDAMPVVENAPDETPVPNAGWASVRPIANVPHATPVQDARRAAPRPIATAPDAIPVVAYAPDETPFPNTGRASARPIANVPHETPVQDARRAEPRPIATAPDAMPLPHAARTEARPVASKPDPRTPSLSRDAIASQSIGGMAIACAAARVGASPAPAHIEQPERRGMDPFLSGGQAILPVPTPVPAQSEHLALPTEESPHSPQHDFFEELADRLEQAAAEMGLGEE